MNSSGLEPDLLALQSLAADVAVRDLLPICAKVDHEGVWPTEGMAAIARSGLMGLHIPKRLGGLEQGLLALAVVTEELGAACSSTAMCLACTAWPRSYWRRRRHAIKRKGSLSPSQRTAHHLAGTSSIHAL